MSEKAPAPLKFSPAETEILGRTADALTAYMGTPVVAEIIHIDEGDFESVIFAIPLQENDSDADITPVQIGGPGARLVGNLGGLELDPTQVYACRLLWAIQLADLEGVRYIKIDSEGEEIAWSDTLDAMLPFALTKPAASNDEEDEDEEAPNTAPDSPAFYIDPSDTLH